MGEHCVPYSAGFVPLRPVALPSRQWLNPSIGPDIKLVFPDPADALSRGSMII